MLRVVGIVALVVLAIACTPNTVKTVPSPSPVIPEGTWSQSLTFTGELPGQMTGIIPGAGDLMSTCTGSKTHVGEKWADTIYGGIDAAGQIWGVVIVIDNFSGPGTYQDKAVKVEMHSVDNARVWQSGPGDKVTFTLERNQQTGTIDATMTSAATGKVGAERITGRWNCRG
ncbi:MAG: hypothetical protein PVSMB3_08030 [Candidatus Dormibacteraceae bacterium]